MTDPAYSVLLIGHVLSAVLGFGALSATGAYAAAVRRSADPFSSPTLLRFFRPGHDFASYALYLVPVFGGALVLRARHGAAGHPFVLVGLGLWLVAVTVATTGLAPAERAIKSVLAGDGGRAGELGALCRRCEQAAIVISLCFLGAFVVMIVQPG